MENQNQPRESVSPEDVNMPANDDDMDEAVYAGLGVDNDPDIMNPGSEEATDTVLHTDTATAHHATDGVSNSADADTLPDDLLAEETPDDDRIDEEIAELAEEEEEGNQRY